MSLRNPVMLVIALSAAPLQAATEFDNGLIPLELVNQITGNIGARVYRSLPDTFPVPATLPAGLQLRLLGSQEYLSGHQQLFLRSPQAPKLVLDQLRQAYLDEGWQDLSSSSNASMVVQLCHEQLGDIFVGLQGIAPDRLTHFTAGRSPVNNPQSCTARARDNDHFQDVYTRMQERFPVLEVPAQTLQTPPYALLSGSQRYGGNLANFSMELERRGSITVPGSSAADLHEHFAAQLREQGWVRDSGGSGALSASSVWQLADAAALFAGLVDGSPSLSGTLSVLDSREDSYRVAFMLYVQHGDGARGTSVIGIYPSGFYSGGF